MLSRLTRLTLLAALAAVFANGALAATKDAATGSYYTPAALHALAARSAGMQGEARHYEAATKPTRGSNRESVIVGAAAASVAAALAGVLVAIMRRRKRTSVPSTLHSDS